MVRNAGNIIPPLDRRDPGGVTTASIEHGVSVLGVRDIVVCGHSGCRRTMTALMKRSRQVERTSPGGSALACRDYADGALDGVKGMEVFR